MHLVRSALHLVCWCAVVVCTGWMCLQLLGGRVGRWTTSAQALTPWVVPWAAIAAVVAVSLGRNVAAISAALVAGTFLALVAPLAVPSGLPDAGGPGVTVLHANLLYSNPDIGGAIRELLAVDADVIAVSELTPEFAAAFDASAIGERYPYRVARPGDAAIGLGIWSRRPITEGDPVPGSTMTLTADLELDGRTLHLLLAHPLPPLFQGDHWLAEMTVMRALSAERLADMVVVADLNVSYYHPPLRRFLDDTDLRDVHVALGRGFSFSWPTDEVVPPFVRLDHALVGENVTATTIEDHDVPGGDHRAFAVTVAWAA